MNNNRLILRIAVTSAVGLLSALLVTLTAFVCITCRAVTVEVGENLSLEAIHSSDALNTLYTVKKYTIDTSKPCDTKVTLRFLGFLPSSVRVHVRDTVPPTLTVTDIHSSEGAAVTAEDFVLSCTDATDVTFTSSVIPSSAGEYKVMIKAVDEGGNTAEAEASLTVHSTAVTAELGKADPEADMRKANPSIKKIDSDSVKSDEVGEYLLRGESDDARYIWLYKIEDTAAPEFEITNTAVRLGTELTPELLVGTVTDESEYTLVLEVSPDSIDMVTDTSKEGIAHVTVTAEDSHGNGNVKSADILIASVPEALSFEYGVTEDDISSAILSPTSLEGFTLENLTSALGEHEVLAKNGGFVYKISLSVVDTSAPELTLKPVYVYKCTEVTPESFIASCTDNSKVTLAFDDAPNTAEVGEQKVTVTAVDEGGNETKAEAVLTVLDDTTPPTIYGIYNQTIRIGENVSFKKGVYATDPEIGNVAFKVNASAVNTNAVGTYPVTYTASDSAGNTAEATVYLNVIEVSERSVNALADGVLAKIINKGMSQREKAEAIYEWCVDTMSYSTRTSYLMGNFIEGAYSGFTVKSGNCYIYYAVSTALMNRAGIENMMIERNDPSNPHVWSLVKMDGNWYHFDTCPSYPDHKLRCFLLTDYEVWVYSQNEVKNYYSFDSWKYPATP